MLQKKLGSRPHKLGYLFFELANSMTELDIIDISQQVDSSTTAYFGDTPFSLSWLANLQIKTSEICVTPHVGTHADAPMHFSYSTEGIGDIPLNMFVGDCLVAPAELAVDVQSLKEWEVFKKYKECGKILFKFEDKTQGLGLDVAELLVNDQFHLIGTNSESIDNEDSEDFPIHHLLLGRGICVLENLVLERTDPGIYFLSAAPLKWRTAEASPVRAFLLKKRRAAKFLSFQPL